MLDDLPGVLGSFNVFLDTTLLVSIVAVVWTFARRLAQEAYFLLSIRTQEITFQLEPHDNIPAGIDSLNYLFIRYGNDTYMQWLASDQDRHHGRLRNKIVCVTRKMPAPGAPITVRMRVHKRLGTQFKFFVDVTGDPEPVRDYLEAHASISDVSCKQIPGSGNGKPARHRLFFLLDRLDSVKTIEGFSNNFVYPV